MDTKDAASKRNESLSATSATDIRKRVKELTSSSAPQFHDYSSSPEDYYCLSSLDVGLDPEDADHADSVLAFEKFMREHGESRSGKEKDGRKLDALDLADIEKQLSGKFMKRQRKKTNFPSCLTRCPFIHLFNCTIVLYVVV